MASIPVNTIFEGISAAIVEAWGAVKVYDNMPREVPSGRYAVVLPQPVERTGGNSVKVSYSMQWLILGRFPLSTLQSSTIIQEQDRLANLLMPQLQGEPVFFNVAGLPTVERVEFSDMDDVKERTFEIAITFSCRFEGRRDGG